MESKLETPGRGSGKCHTQASCCYNRWVPYGGGVRMDWYQWSAICWAVRENFVSQKCSIHFFLSNVYVVKQSFSWEQSSQLFIDRLVMIIGENSGGGKLKEAKLFSIANTKGSTDVHIILVVCQKSWKAVNHWPYSNYRWVSRICGILLRKKKGR